MSLQSRPAEPDLRTLMRQEEERDAKVAHRRHLANVTLLVPPVAGVVLLVLAAILKGPAFAGALVGQAVIIFTVAGKFAILQAVLTDGGFTAVELATLVAYMDVSVAVVLVYNLPRLYRLKRLGPTLEELAEHGLYMLEQKPWMGRVTFAGVIAFVMFPLTGTGAIGGSIFGRLLGLSARRTLVAIAVGACLGSYGMALFGESIRAVFTPEMQASWQFKATGIAALLLMIGIVWWRGRKVTHELRARRAAREARSDNA
jgi:uncharacterized membrane protein